MISKWARWLEKMHRLYASFAWNEKHILLAFRISTVQLLGLSTMVGLYHTCQRWMCLQVTDLQSCGRSEAGDEQQLRGLRHGLWVSQDICSTACPNHEGRGLPPLEQHMTQQGHGCIYWGHCAELVSNIPSRSMWLLVRKAAWFRKSLLFRESLSTWAVHQPPHELLYLLLLTTRFSQAWDVVM